jgi:membrane-bound acyltransferase YfiQ involved in biofilm formation
MRDSADVANGGEVVTLGGNPKGARAALAMEAPRPLRDRNHVPEFHWLRSLACLGVVMIHAVTMGFEVPAWRGIAPGIGVLQMLLMFSTPTFIFLSAAQIARSYGRPPPDFLARRIRFILVPYVVVNIGYGAIKPILRWDSAGGLSSFISLWWDMSLANLLGASHLWFVIPMFQFYLVYAAFGHWTQRIRWRPVLIGTLIANLAYLALFNFSTPLEGPYAQMVGHHWFSFFLPAWIFYFALGLWAGTNYAGFLRLLDRLRRFHLLAVCLAAVMMLWAHYSGLLFDTSSRRVDVLIYASLVIALLLRQGSNLGRIPSILVAVSQRSFGIYLLHPFLLSIVAVSIPLERIPPLAGVLALFSAGAIGSFFLTGALGRMPGGWMLVGRVRQGPKAGPLTVAVPGGMTR